LDGLLKDTLSTDDEDAAARIRTAAAARHPVRVPPALAALIDPADPSDPIARQVVPAAAELQDGPGDRPDPTGDAAHTPLPGLVHRHADRVLLMPATICPVYCRFCFRRGRLGPGHPPPDRAELDAALAYIAAHPEIRETILTGGDPLMLAPRRLADLIARLDAIPHVDGIRVHSRVPIADPDRLTPALLDALTVRESALWLSLHTNHPRELSPPALAGIDALLARGIPLVSQTVLLKGVNDDADVLAALFRALVKARVKPYYLHHLDPAPGTGHFRVGLAEGQALMAALRRRLSGLALPAYVLDIPGGHGKVPVGPAHVAGSEAEGWTITDPDGVPHPYPAA
jgi:lysine 2,3-aminomutase